MILPYMTKQLLYATMVDFKNLLQYKYIKFTDFVHPQFGQKAAEVAEGYCVVILVDGVCFIFKKILFFLSCWICF